MSYTLLLPDEYTADIIKRIDKAKYRVNMIALVILEDDMTHGVIDALVRAAARGVEVSVGMDLYFTYRELGSTDSKTSYIISKVRNMRATKQRLEEASAQVRWLSQFGTTFVSRRTHLKWTIVDDTVFSFGGINMYDLGLMSNDYMFRTQNHELADELHEVHARVISSDAAGRPFRSFVFGRDNHLVLLDGGRFGDSIIYRHVLRYAEEAEHIIYVSQYCPNGKLSRRLKRVNAEIYFNPWQNAEDSLNRFLIWISAKLHRVESAYKKRQYLHGKFMIFTMPGGQEIAITGSHNFLGGNGLLGTREVALETTDPEIIAELKHFLNQHVKGA